jgi:hypothetical protein
LPRGSCAKTEKLPADPPMCHDALHISTGRTESWTASRFKHLKHLRTGLETFWYDFTGECDKRGGSFRMSSREMSFIFFRKMKTSGPMQSQPATRRLVRKRPGSKQSARDVLRRCYTGYSLLCQGEML